MLQERFEKFYEVSDWNFEVAIQRFIFNFKVSRVSKLGGTREGEAQYIEGLS